MSVKYLSPYVSKQQETNEFIDHLTGGWKSVVEAKTMFLPLENKEETESYLARHEKALYEDSFNTTIDGLVGLIFKKEINYNDDIPAKLAPMIENADGMGNHMDILIEKLFNNAIRKGISFALVDMPKADNVRNKADEINQGIRPYVTIIEPENVTSWKTKTINGQVVLSQVKIKESIQIDDRDNPYKLNTIEQYRILEIGTYKIIQIKENEEVLIDEGFTNLNYIPLVALNLNQKGFFETFPPFYDLGKLNIAHYQIASDIRYNNHLACVPVLKMLGFGDDEVKQVVISVNKAITSTNEEAKVEWLDYDGSGAENSERTLKRIESKIMEMGLAIISDSTAKTATEVEISGSQKQSKMNKWVRLLEDTVELIFQMSAGFYNESDGGSIKIEADILSKPITSEEVTTLVNMQMNRQMSLKTMYSIIQSGSYKVPSDFDYEVERELLNSEDLLIGKE